MKRQRPLLLMLLVIYIFAPVLFSWIVHPDGGWYRPFVIWLLVVLIAFIIQYKSTTTPPQP
ncbi:hypothetical protein [Teredinibacter purpureus]|uniref:hypothetical protein n=1 Tax=Teredinibacter purpureus TaxID=2731756 RepID=UPI0009E19BC8|nr:hypothetical protein [Teredinibacter purpureus]